MISVVTGTLNRLNLLPKIIENTVGSNPHIELVLVDGGSNDGTIDFIKSINHERIKLIENGERSYYWHYMNLGIKESSHEWVCQWNDDIILETGWDPIIEEINKTQCSDFYIFSWKENEKYVIIENDRELVMNYGIYNKKIFREIGMYDSSYKYYFCDGDMSFRAKSFGYSYTKLQNVKCHPLTEHGPEKRAFMSDAKQESDNYYEKLEMYKNGKLPSSIIKLD
jgi:glycosyltransferase involved in cell wall biosynthesis